MKQFNDRQVFNALLRQDLNAFVEKVFATVDPGSTYIRGWYIQLMCQDLMAFAEGTLKRSVITLPPRHLKSICASVALVAWVLGRDPAARVMCVSYSDELSQKLARDCKKVMESDWYRRLFPGTRISKTRSATHDFETTRGGGRYATSVGGALTGRGADLIIIDDPIKPQDALSDQVRGTVNQWFNNTALSRLNDPEGGGILIIMQRTHIDDLVGHVLANSEWAELCLPAIAEEDEEFTVQKPDGSDFDVGRKKGEALHPARFSLAELEERRSLVGAFNFSAQYQQCPVPLDGNLVKWSWFRFFDTVPPPKQYSDKIVQSWDTALSLSETADWSVCTTWHIRGEDYYLVDVFRARLDFPSLKKKVVDLKRQYQADAVLIEDAGAGKGLIQQLCDDGDVRPVAIRPEGSKADRMVAQSAVIEAGRVLLPEQASWISPFKAELNAFPSGSHDDQVDSMSQFLNWTTQRGPEFSILHVRA